jgi:AraC-like DNA-binding protein
MFQAQYHAFKRHPMLPHLELRKSANSSNCYLTHTHEEYSFGLIDAGQAIYCHGDRRTPIAPGMVVMMQPGLPHSCNPQPEQTWSYRMLYVDAQWVQRMASPSKHQVLHTNPALTCNWSSDPVMHGSLSRIFDLLQTHTPALEVDESLVNFLSRHALRLVDETVPGTTCLASVKRAKDLITTCPQDNLSLESLALACGLSPCQLIRRFKLAYGQTPHAFQIDQRVNLAKKLLKQGQPIIDVALQTGFADQAHFQRHFKKRHALTPRAYLGR